ncbi:MAG: hypothetical protein AB1393_07895 [Candidatus Edwardsbacteria bacterium]
MNSLRKNLILFFYFFLITNLLIPAFCFAAGKVYWQTDGVPICTFGADQMNPVIVPDMKGGGIIIWQDWRSGNLDIYAQRVDSAGNRLWTNNGVPLAASATNENEPKAVSDMRGGKRDEKVDFCVSGYLFDSRNGVCL